MKKQIHQSQSRGMADHGWLKSAHSFSFASYYNPDRMGHGALRVLNDDFVEQGKGFGTHPHKDMEIISIPLKGKLAHKDSEGNQAIIEAGEVQIMSAGTGVYHSEFNDSSTEPVEFLQIWVQPEKLGITPRYDQYRYDQNMRPNEWTLLVSPLDQKSEAKGVKINQQAYFTITNLESGKDIDYQLTSPQNGVYLFVIEGQIDIHGDQLGKRDALAVEDTSGLTIKAIQASKVLAIEIPMGHAR
jgi:redox-sensitive bicupin YhaK (pirin superfamily)